MIFLSERYIYVLAFCQLSSVYFINSVFVQIDQGQLLEVTVKILTV